MRKAPKNRIPDQMAGLLRLYWANGGGGLTVQTTQTTGESWARGQQVQQGFQKRHIFLY